MSVIKADKSKLNSMINYINEKATESETLCNNISRTYDQVPWSGSDRSSADQNSDRMRLNELKNAIEDFRSNAEQLKNWVKTIETFQEMMRSMIRGLEN